MGVVRPIHHNRITVVEVSSVDNDRSALEIEFVLKIPGNTQVLDHSQSSNIIDFVEGKQKRS
jgi:cell division protein FtsL